jgi:RNA polymerase sigma factor (sigma-70 family)
LVASGSEPAFATLYERYRQPLYRYCRSILRDDADAQDALQSTFVAALTALRRGQRDAPIRPWLFRIAHNNAISVVRRRRASEELTDELPLLGRSAEEEAADRARLAQLLADLGELPDRQRSAVVMRELNGLSHDEIGVALQTSAGAAKQTLFEARQALLEFSEGRTMSCEAIQRTISAGDRRVLRGRRVRAHLRDCAACAGFAAAIPARSADLKALVPPLAPLAAASVFARVSATASSPAATGGGIGATGGGIGATGGGIGAGGGGISAGSGGIGAALASKVAGATFASKAVAAVAILATTGAVTDVVTHSSRTTDSPAASHVRGTVGGRSPQPAAAKVRGAGGASATILTPAHPFSVVGAGSARPVEPGARGRGSAVGGRSRGASSLTKSPNGVPFAGHPGRPATGSRSQHLQGQSASHGGHAQTSPATGTGHPAASGSRPATRPVVRMPTTQAPTVRHSAPRPRTTSPAPRGRPSSNPASTRPTRPTTPRLCGHVPCAAGQAS